MKNAIRMLGVAAGFALASSMAMADSISPETYSATLGIGESVTITKTVVISKGSPTSALLDVKFIADTTGSMGSIISTVRNNATTIMNNLSGLGDAQFGASEYKDRTDGYTTKVNQTLTSDTASVQAGINTWGASGGYDAPEANLIALKEQAQAADWREGSNRFIVQFGDAPGHEGGAYPTLSDTITALDGNNVKVIVVGTNGMNNSCGGSDCAAGQATAIANATGGSFNLIGGGTDIAQLIEDAIGAAFASYSNVSLGLVGSSGGVGVSFNPISYAGSYDRSEDRTFTFDVTFTGLAAGTWDFGVGAFVDGGRVALETDQITVTAAPVSSVPLPGALPMLLGALGVSGSFLRRRRRS
ncbi:PEP-CTERM sorting domain-containing protein [Comamonas badia]|uniref:PEP-CTERM sorting domain-containing protein n=1 Tax=Comamonas badia TaxID=265291 RepID=UPI000B0752A7|nr:PEP-CTERM sorting domain-containing protein [Comamonas badia]